MIRTSLSPSRGNTICISIRMLSRRSLLVLLATFASLTVLLVTSRRINNWNTFDSPYYRPGWGRPHNQAGGTKPSDPAPATATQPDTPPRPTHDPACENFPDTSNILLVMKTGASEAFDKIPTQLQTMLRCLPDYLIFSDLDQTVAGYHIRDSLDRVLPEAMDSNTDFNLYRRQKECLVDIATCSKLGNPAHEGWTLDKYKNVHIAEKTWALRPGYQWYVFVDADSYVLWPNMVKWLRHFSPNRHTYIGSVTSISDFIFAHGGSGYVVSQAAMRDGIGAHPGIANKFDVRAHSECCGDYLFALAMHDTINLGVKNVWPTINGEKPYTLPYGPSHWCHPIVTMHHLSSEEISSMWEYEQTRWGYNASSTSVNGSPASKVTTIKDIYMNFVAHHLQAVREDWDNYSDDRYYLDPSQDHSGDWRASRRKDINKYNEFELKAHLSFEDCGRACESIPFEECFTYRWHERVCSISNAFRMGKPVHKADKEEKRTKSGWDIKKIREWVDKQPECTEIRWPSGA